MKQITFSLYFLLILLIFIISLVEVSGKNIEEDLIIDVYGPNVIRTGNETIFILRIKNINEEDNDLIIKSINIFDIKNKKVKESKPDRIIKSIRDEIDYLNKIENIKSEQNEYINEKIIPKLYENEFKESFLLNIYNIDPSPQLGEIITIPIEIKIKIDGKSYTINKQYSVLISQLLPGPPHD